MNGNYLEFDFSLHSSYFFSFPNRIKTYRSQKISAPHVGFSAAIARGSHRES
jgi:hypothetical protein